jgi:hypothetical protein
MVRDIDFRQHAQGGGYRFFWRIRFLVALPPARHLLIGAKNLFFAAKVAWHEVPPSRGEREANSAVVGRRPVICGTHPKGQPGHSVVGPGWLQLGAQQLPVRHLNRRVGSPARHSTFVA